MSYKSSSDSAKQTTAEAFAVRQERRDRRIRHLAVFGVACAVTGALLRFTQVSQAAAGGDGPVIAADTSRLVDGGFSIPDESTFARYPRSGELETSSDGIPVPVSDADVAKRVAEAKSGWKPMGDYIPRRLVVRLVDYADEDQIDDVVDATGYTSLETVSYVMSRTIVLDIGGDDIAAARAKVLAQPYVFSCLPDYVLDFADEDEGDTGDSQLLQTESVPGSVELDSQRWDYDLLRYEDVWNESQANGRLAVAVIDSEFDISHKDLKNLVVNPRNVTVQSGELTSGARLGTSGSDHGTHVAEIVSAEAGNSFGMTGLSHNACIMPVQCRDTDSGRITTSSLVSSLQEVLWKAEGDEDTPPVRVVNISVTAYVPRDYADDIWEGMNFRKAFESLNQHGVLVVTAAGNDSSDASSGYVSIPGYYSNRAENIINVMSLDMDGGKLVRRDASNRNPAGSSAGDFIVQVGAPGSDILSGVPFGDDRAYNPNGNLFRTKDGTSQAAPEVSATAALMFAANPDLSPLEAKSIICSTATDIGPAGPDAGNGFGCVNPLAAVRKSLGKSLDGTELRMPGSQDSTQATAAPEPEQVTANEAADSPVAEPVVDEVVQETSSSAKGSLSAPVIPLSRLPHVRIPVSVTVGNVRYTFHLPYLREGKAGIASYVAPLVSSHSPSQKMDRAATAQVLDSLTAPASTTGASVVDEQTGQTWVVSSMERTDIALLASEPQGDQSASYEVSLTNQQTGETVSAVVSVSVPGEAIADGGQAEASTAGEVASAIAWADSEVTLRTAGNDAVTVSPASSDSADVITDDPEVAKAGIVSVDDPFRLADGGSRLVDVRHGVTIGDGQGGTIEADAYEWEAIVLHPDSVSSTVSDSGTDFSDDNNQSISKSIDVTIYNPLPPTEKPAASDKGDDTPAAVTPAPTPILSPAEEGGGTDVNNATPSLVQDTTDGQTADTPSTPTPAAPSAPTASASDLMGVRIWVGGRACDEFAYDRHEYELWYDAGAALPEAPTATEIPEDKGWRLSDVRTSQASDGNGTTHELRFTNDDAGLSESYYFTYRNKDPQPEQEQAPAQAQADAGTEAAQPTQATQTPVETAKQAIAQTTGRIAQTGDTALMVGGSVIAVSCGAWTLARGRRREA